MLKMMVNGEHACNDGNLLHVNLQLTLVVILHPPQHQYHGQLVIIRQIPPAFSTISCTFIGIFKPSTWLGARPWLLATQVLPRSLVFLGCRGYLWSATGSLKSVGISAARNVTGGNVDTSSDQEHTMLRYHCIADLS